MTIPKTQLKYIVDRMHVGASDDKVRAEVRRRVGVHPGWTQKLVAQAEVYALKVHRENARMYAYVMGGGVGRRGNPKSPKPRRGVVKIAGRTVRVGSKRHAILTQQQRIFDDLMRGETGRGRNPTQVKW